MKYLLVLVLVTVASAQFFGRSQFSRGGFNRFGGGSSNSGEVAIDHSTASSEYHYSWLHDGFREYDHSGVVSYCRRLGSGWTPVSIETQEESSFVNGVVGSHRLNWIWTGGVKAGAGWRWLDGSTFNGLNWSHTGGFRRPQPDNREGNENCLAILNDFYRDGIKWHDVACHHRKPTICERSK